MPKKKPKTKQKKSERPILIYSLLAIGVVILSIALISFLVEGYKQRQLERNFEKLEETISEISEKLNNTKDNYSFEKNRLF